MPEVDEAADIEEVQAWAAGLDALHARIAGLFARAEPRRRVLAYLRGLLRLWFFSDVQQDLSGHHRPTPRAHRGP